MSKALLGELTLKQKRFADAYIISGNVTQAAKDAGYSVKSAHVVGAETLRYPKVQAYINNARKPEEAKTQALQQRVLAELERLAFANLADFVRIDEDGNPQVDLSNATREQMSALTRASTKRRKIYNAKGDHIGTEENISVSMADKYRGLEMLGRHLGMFKEAEQHVVIDVADHLLEARARLVQIQDLGRVDTEEGE